MAVEKMNAIPSWFNLNKYSNLEGLSLTEFSLNIAVRGHIHVFLKTSTGYDSEYMNGMIELIKIKPTLDLSDLRELYDSIYESDFDKSREGWRHGAGLGVVTTLPLRKAYEIYEVINEDTELRNFFSRANYYWDSNKHYKDWYENVFLMGSINESGTLISEGFFDEIVSIDTTASDEQLIDGFKDWLKTHRLINGKHDHNEENQRSIKDLRSFKNRLIRGAVMPYLDLRMHEKIEGIKLPLHKMGDAIFPYELEIDTSEAVRKTTKALARLAFQNALVFVRRSILEEGKK